LLSRISDKTSVLGGLSDKARRRFIDQTTQTVDGFKSNLSNPTILADCHSIAPPTLIVCGGNTAVPERRVTEILRDEIPNSVYEILPDAEHMSPLTHLAEVANLIQRHWRTNS
jgi:pimeloyl-ACP methyl ester carboxylesterase